MLPRPEIFANEPPFDSGRKRDSRGDARYGLREMDRNENAAVIAVAVVVVTAVAVRIGDL